MAVRPSDFHEAARISASLPWLKIALITAQYLCPDDKIIEGPLNIWYCNLLSKKDFERIAKASRGQTQTMSLGKVEAFLAYLANKYVKVAGISKGMLMLEILAAFARAARAVLMTKDLEEDAVGGCCES